MTRWLRTGAVVAAVLAAVLAPAVPAGAADANGDGRADVYWRNRETGQLGAWLVVDSDIQPYTVSRTCGGACARTWAVVGFGDFDRDDVSDIWWFNATTGVVSIWEMGRAGLVRRIENLSTRCAGSCATSHRPIGVGDLDHDGIADLYWLDTTAGVVSVWMPNVQGLSVRTRQLSLPCQARCQRDWKPVAVGDEDGNGSADVLWFDRRSGELSFWRLERNGRVTDTPVWSLGCDGVCTAADVPFGIGDVDGNGTGELFTYDPVSGNVQAEGTDAEGGFVTGLRWTCGGDCPQTWKLLGVAG